MEIYDFEEIKGFNTYYKGVVCNGWNIIIYAMNESGAYYKEYPPAPDFFVVYKTFYKSGKIKSIGRYTGEHLGIGKTINYDEKGNVINVIDENSKFEKVKLEDLLKFIEQEGWINLKTGQGGEEIAFSDDGRGYIKKGVFQISFKPKGQFREEYKDFSVWIITIKPSSENDNYRTIYFINGETGEILDKQRERVLYKE